MRWCSCSRSPAARRNRPWLLPRTFVLTDFWWNPESECAVVRANWKLSATLAVARLEALRFLEADYRSGTAAGRLLYDGRHLDHTFHRVRAYFEYLLNFV